MVLISKSNTAERIRYYRSISLVNCTIKKVSKMLANRVGPVLQRYIGEYQTGFISGFIHKRSILNGIVLTHEIIHQAKRERNVSYILKLDFEKAYDVVNWECLMEILKNKGFGPQKQWWVHSWLNSTKTQVLFNGEPGREIKCRWRLR